MVLYVFHDVLVTKKSNENIKYYYRDSEKVNQ